jgi:hypothetical protein
MRSDEEEKSRLAAQLESATREREQLRADAQHMSTEIQRLQTLADAAQRTARDCAETLESAQRRYLSAESQTEAERRDKERMRAEGEGLREDLKVAERQRDGERAERERLQRELEMERRERDMMREDESDRMHRAGEAEEHKLQALEREKAGLERNVRMLEMRRREWAERELKWDAERADLLERQRLAELELGQLRAGRAEREQALASTEELAHKQVNNYNITNICVNVCVSHAFLIHRTRSCARKWTSFGPNTKSWSRAVPACSSTLASC